MFHHSVFDCFSVIMHCISMKPPCKLKKLCALTITDYRSLFDAIYDPSSFRGCPFFGGGSVVVETLFRIVLIVCWSLY